VAPSDERTREIALRPDEILTEILVPAAATHSATYEVRQKDGARLAAGRRFGGHHHEGGGGLGANRARPRGAHALGSPAAGEWLAGKTITVETAEAAGKAAVDGAQPLSHNAYKVTLARTAVKRALLAAAKVRA
jgi:xanthine dehydrogenase YagS FAD-binding subunit